MVHDRLAMYFNYTDAAHRDMRSSSAERPRSCGHSVEPGLGEGDGKAAQRDEQGVPCSARRGQDASWEKGPRRLPFLLRRPRGSRPCANPKPVGRKAELLREEVLQRRGGAARPREEATRFARDLSIPFTNNAAESSLRMAKLHRKISGCFQGDDSAQHFAAIRSYIATARKHGVGALDVLGRLFSGDVWMPPSLS